MGRQADEGRPTPERRVTGGNAMHTSEVWIWVYPDGTEVSDHDHAVATALGRTAELEDQHGGRPEAHRVPGEVVPRFYGFRGVSVPA
jgi:hypothetical protein